MHKLKQWFNDFVMLPLVDMHDEDALKRFAISMSIAFPVIFMALLPWLFNAIIPKWPAALSLVLMFFYFLAPRFLYYPYVVWMLIASVVGFINTRIILALAYYCLIVPIGLFMQRRKGLQYKHHVDGKSAWVLRDKQATKENLKEPF